MSSITVSDVQKLASLSALVMEDDEAEGLATELAQILDYVEQLDEVDTEGVEPTYQVIDLNNMYRQDEVASGVDPTDLLISVPTTKDQQILVPKVL